MLYSVNIQCHTQRHGRSDRPNSTPSTSAIVIQPRSQLMSEMDVSSIQYGLMAELSRSYYP